MGEPLTFKVEHFHLSLNVGMRMMVPLGKGFNVGGGKLNFNHGSGTFFNSADRP
jgi:hypothetical protein